MGRYAESDAANRAARTFWQGMFVAVVIAVCAVLVNAFSGITEFTPAFWTALAVSLTQAVATAAASYTQRKLEGK